MKINLSFIITLFAVLAFLLSGCGATPLFPQTDSMGPEETVESFYRWYIGYPGNPLSDGAYRDSPYLSADLVQEAAETIASFEYGAYDPFLCAQDIPQSFTLDPATISGDRASVVVHYIWNAGTEYEATTDMTVELQRAGSEWRIDSIPCTAPALPSATEPATLAPPEQTVRLFYDWYLAASAYDEASQTRTGPLSTGAYRSSTHLTESFIQQVDQHLASPEQGSYDPFLCAQDVPESFTIGQATRSASTASLRVETSFEGHAFTVALRLVDDAWRIDGVTCEEAPLADVPVQAGQPAPVRDGWQIFHDTTYGYQISYPADWTTIELDITMPELSAPVVRIVQFMPQALADEMAARSGPPDPNAPALVAPFNVEVSVGSLEEYRRMYYETSIVEETEINGLPVIVEKDDPGDFQVIRYMIQHPTTPDLRITVVDYLNGFPARVAGNEDVAALVPQILSTFTFDQ
ncbi:MAG: DUF3828 domain-containing protein [Anaerolineae bacterium]|nr:DUF3828 domain-containing protein [Anaerolineae bacterium]